MLNTILYSIGYILAITLGYVTVHGTMHVKCVVAHDIMKTSAGAWRWMGWLLLEKIAINDALPSEVAIALALLLISGRNASIKITHGAILWFFAPQGRHVPLIITKLGTSEETPMPCQISRRSVHIWGFLTQKTSKIPNFARDESLNRCLWNL